MFPEAGEKLGPYEILGALGGGGMARVYRAWDGRLHREVAIKVIDENFDMPGIGERFLREARAASGLNHPNICTIFDIGEQNGVPYLVMELLEGETLRERIDQDAVSVDDILRFGAEVSDALAAAHARGIVHRDIKPANIFLVKKPNGSAQTKVLDFGLAKVERQASEERQFASNLTSMGATVGTVSYMSPEQARGEDLDARSDLFSLGIVMYEMATGRLPFHGNTSALVFVQLLGQMAPEPIRKFNGEIPADLEAVIMKLLAKSARARYQSATELTDQLQDLAEKRSGWLSRVKAPSPSTSGVQRIPGLARMPRDPGGNEAAQKAAQPWNVRRPEGDSGQTPRAPNEAGFASSGNRPVRTSIASNPKMSYPVAAPYMGQSGLHSAAHGTQVKAADGASAVAARRGNQGVADGVSGFSGMRAVARDPHAAGESEVFSGRTRPEPVEQATIVGGDGLGWQWIALAIALVVVLAGVLAWKLGWMGHAAPIFGSALLMMPIRGRTDAC